MPGPQACEASRAGLPGACLAAAKEQVPKGKTRSRYMKNRATRSRWMLVTTSAALVVALAWPLVGQAEAQDSETGPVDEKATGLLQGMSDYLSKETAVSFRARTFFDVVQ